MREMLQNEGKGSIWGMTRTLIHLKAMFGDYYCINLGDSCIQNVHLGRYIIGYIVGNLLLRHHERGVVKRDFWPYMIYLPNETFEYGYPHSNAFLQFYLKSEGCKWDKA